MREISGKDLADLLEKKFEGQVQFEGRVIGYLLDKDPNSPEFYSSSGKFTLHTSILKGLEGNYFLESEGTTFGFKQREETKIEYLTTKDNKELITIPITLNNIAVLRMELLPGSTYNI